MKSKESMVKILQGLFFASPFCLGIFHIFLSCTATIALSVVIIVLLLSNKNLSLFHNDSLLSVGIIVIGYGFSSIWAVDRGVALMGFFKFLPLLPFSVLVMHLSGDEKKRVLSVLPLCGSMMTVLSYLLHFVPSLKELFMVNKRLAGFFQYPNTFAAFLLVGLIICFFSQMNYWKKII